MSGMIPSMAIVISAVSLIVMLTSLIIGRKDRRDAAIEMDSKLRTILEYRDIQHEDRILDLEERLRSIEGIALEVRLQSLELDKKGIREWKHKVIDPYVPGAVDALKHRVDRVEEFLNGRYRALLDKDTR